MQAICGYVRLDGAPARAEALTTLAANLCPNAELAAPTHTLLEGSVGFGHAHWGGRSQAPADCVIRDVRSGCMVVADARLDERLALAATLGLDGVTGAAELVLRAWLKWGEGCADRLRGDFAFAIWDERRRRLYCARDSMGLRPLYIHYRPGKLVVFATRALALVALPEVPGTLDEARIADALVIQLEHVDKTSTFFREVKRLPPAHWAVFSPEGRRESEYWRPLPGRVSLPRSHAAQVEALADLLETAVRRHLDGDQRVGSMLSGGMDSSSLVAIAADQLAGAGQLPLQTFSSISDDPDEPETRAIHAMLDYPHLKPTLIDPNAVDAMRAELVRAVMQSDEPFEGNIVLLRAQYQTAAARGVDALLDGVDGDLVFGGPSTLRRQVRAGHWHAAWRNWHGLRQAHAGYRGWRYPASVLRAAFVPAALHRLVRPERPDARELAAIQNSLIDAVFADRVALRERLLQRDAWLRGAACCDTTGEAAMVLAHPFLTSAIERYHRVAAWYGVEPRHPLLDRDLLEWCVNLPAAQRLRDGWPKAVLRDALRGRLPDRVCWRRGRQHLGWMLIQRTLLADGNNVRDELAAQRALLTGRVDLARLDAAMARAWPAADAYADRVQVLAVLSLGRWLARQLCRR